MIAELRKELIIIKSMGNTPNFSELGRRYNLDPRTVKKYYEGYRGKASTRNKKSMLDKYIEEIKEKATIAGTKVTSLYHFFVDMYHDIGSYSNFLKYLRKHEIMPQKTLSKAHPRFETELGQQLQFDWKEDIKMYNRKGELFLFNVFTAILSASRLKVFVYSRYRTRDDVIRCLLFVFEQLQGVPKEALTDCMSSIFNATTKKFVAEFIQFSKDMGFKARNCKVGSPETKGKCESSNRFLNWLKPYNYDFDDEEDLIKILAKISRQANLQVNSTTQVTPIMLFQKEKEYLNPLPDKRIRDSYLVCGKQVVVESDCLIYHKGSRYSVLPMYIGKKVKITEVENKLQIYYNNKLLTTHEINDKPYNYHDNHYFQMYKEITPYKTDEEILELTKQNLKLLDELYVIGKEMNEND